MNRGGKREGAGRKRVVPEVQRINKGFSTLVLARIKELKLRDVNGNPIESAEDYALEILRKNDSAAHQFFDKLIDRRDGRPAQGIDLNAHVTIDDARRKHIRELISRMAGKSKQ